MEKPRVSKPDVGEKKAKAVEARRHKGGKKNSFQGDEKYTKIK